MNLRAFPRTRDDDVESEIPFLTDMNDNEDDDDDAQHEWNDGNSPTFLQE